MSASPSVPGKSQRNRKWLLYCCRAFAALRHDACPNVKDDQRFNYGHDRRTNQPCSEAARRIFRHTPGIGREKGADLP